MKWIQILALLFLVYAYGVSAPPTQNVDWKAVDNQLNELINQIYGFELSLLLEAPDSTSLTPEVETRIVQHFNASETELDKVFKALFSAAKNETLTGSQTETHLGNIKENVDTLLTAVQPEITMIHPSKIVYSIFSRYDDVKKYIAMASINLSLLLSGSLPRNVIK